MSANSNVSVFDLCIITHPSVVANSIIPSGEGSDWTFRTSAKPSSTQSKKFVHCNYHHDCYFRYQNKYSALPISRLFVLLAKGSFGSKEIRVERLRSSLFFFFLVELLWILCCVWLWTGYDAFSSWRHRARCGNWQSHMIVTDRAGTTRVLYQRKSDVTIWTATKHASLLNWRQNGPQFLAGVSSHNFSTKKHETLPRLSNHRDSNLNSPWRLNLKLYVTSNFPSRKPFFFWLCLGCKQKPLQERLGFLGFYKGRMPLQNIRRQ